MADNFLEKRMEDHRRGLDHGRLSASAVSKKRKLSIDIDRLRLVIAGSTKGLTETIVTVAAAGGARVAFSEVDSTHGRTMAQKTGALFIPHPTDDSEKSWKRCVDCASDRWAGVDAVIVSDGNLKNITFF